ncbi:MAG: HAMP domain-containing protein [Candidatus Omnitrophota bacterium]
MSNLTLITRRRKYIVKKGLQFRYIGLIFALLIFVFAVAGATVFATGWMLFIEKLSNVYPQGRLLVILQNINIALIRNVLIVSPIVFLLGVLFSHKIAGPVLRIEKSMTNIGAGDLAQRINLRTGDELWDLAYIINEAVEKIDNEIKKDKETVAGLQKKMTEIKKVITKDRWEAQEVESSIESLQAEINALESSLNKWSTSK